jgi:hypothetical protein
MDDLIARLEDETRAYILAAMSPDPCGHLAAESLSNLLIIYGTWRSQLIPDRPRRVHVSAELQASPKAREHKAALDVIVAKIGAGDDLGPHLSKAIECDRGGDRMLADFGGSPPAPLDDPRTERAVCHPREGSAVRLFQAGRCVLDRDLWTRHRLGPQRDPGDHGAQLA